MLTVTIPTHHRPATWVAPVAGSVLLGALVVTADDDAGVVLCPFRRCTGGYCPGCGGTRAARRLVHGDVAGAWAHNPWVVLLAAQVVVIGALLLFRGPSVGRTMTRLLLPLTIANGLAAISIWILRLHDGSIPTGWL